MTFTKYWALLVGIFLSSVVATAGTIGIAWDPVAGAVKYRVSYGNTTGVYPTIRDSIPNSTALDVLDCGAYFVAVKAVDVNGEESATYSNEISGWARPLIMSASPALLKINRTYTIRVYGLNFMTGAMAQVPGATAVVTTRESCTSLLVSFAVPSSAPAGPVMVRVTNPDQVFGEAAVVTFYQGPAPVTGVRIQ